MRFFLSQQMGRTRLNGSVCVNVTTSPAPVQTKKVKTNCSQKITQYRWVSNRYNQNWVNSCSLHCVHKLFISQANFPGGFVFAQCEWALTNYNDHSALFIIPSVLCCCWWSVTCPDSHQPDVSWWSFIIDGFVTSTWTLTRSNGTLPGR